jgi:hypothetical protein
MTSHREAPSISQDPVADNTDLYAFVSPDAPNTVTLISNFIPLEEPAGGPNFNAFGNDVLYAISVDNNADGEPDVTYAFRFSTVITNPGTFLYNTGQINSLSDPNWNVKQFYSVTRHVSGKDDDKGTTILGTNLPCPPVNIGPRSIPNYASLAAAAVKDLGNGIKVFAGQRGEGFYVDLGSIFDLAALRPFQAAHLIKIPASENYPPPSGPDGGVNGLKGFNMHSIAIQVPINQLTRDGSTPTDYKDPKAVLGIWTSASREKVRFESSSKGAGHFDEENQSGPFTQVSRLGMPLVNEVLIPLGRKDMWNVSDPSHDSQFLQYYQDPELQNLLPVLYPGVFPNLATLAASDAPRADLVAILLNGIPPGLIPGFQNQTGSLMADYLRLNVAIPPNPATTNNNPPPGSPPTFGILGGDLAGFPNGRRVFDNVTAVELRAIAGATYPLVVKTYSPDAAAGLLTDGSVNDAPYLSAFPYLALPHQGYLHYHDPNSPNDET